MTGLILVFSRPHECRIRHFRNLCVPDRLAFRYIPPEHATFRQTKWQQTFRLRIRDRVDRASVTELANRIKFFTRLQVTFGNGDAFGNWSGKGMPRRLAVNHSLGARKRDLDAAKMVRPKKEVVRTLAHVSLDQPVPETRLVGCEHNKDPGMNPYGEINHPRFRQDAALRFWAKNMVQSFTCRSGAVHAAHIWYQAGGICNTAHFYGGL
jgi:hypothetical protein